MIKSRLFFLVLILVPIFVFGQTERYHRVKIDLTNKNIVLLLKAGIALDHGKLAIGRYYESDFSDKELNLIHHLGFQTQILIEDVESYYADEHRPSELSAFDNGLRSTPDICSTVENNIKNPSNYFEGSMGGYFTYEEMLFILDWMQSQYPYIVTKLDTIKGFTTHEGNPLLYLKVSDFPEVDEDEPEVLYTALHHAREPNSLSQMIYYLWYLMENYQKDPEIKYLIDNTEMYFMPCVNPDGYKYNQKRKPNGGGMWRKNMLKDQNNNPLGVDLNRNYGFAFGYDNSGSSQIPEAETYRGSEAFSEAETAAIREFCSQRHFLMALNYHTFGNFLIHPWGYNDTPTDEDVLFKRLGNYMNSVNNFKMGTGSETVGYTTNGDSDDYMYGETVEKNKIYSFTPEVGPSFWPPKADIEKLNQSCLHMNLALPRLANKHLDHSFNERGKIRKLTDTLSFSFTKSSFSPGEVGVSIYLQKEFATGNAVQTSLNLVQGATELVQLPYEINNNLLHTGKNDIKVYIVRNYGAYDAIDSITFSIYKGKTEAIFSDAAQSMNNWNSTGKWDVTSSQYFSSPSSITDSPSKVYDRNSITTLKLINGFELKDADSPVLTFKAKWSIEKGFDYAFLYALTERGDTIHLCGHYTRPGTKDQKEGLPIYDGIQDNWITESVDLSEFQGFSKLYINFALVSDGYLEQDGIYIDDIEVLSYKDIQTQTVDAQTNPSGAYPNPGNGKLTLCRDENVSGKVAVADIGGRYLTSLSLENTNQVDLTFLENGVYFLTVQYTGGKQEVVKMVITK